MNIQFNIHIDDRLINGIKNTITRRRFILLAIIITLASSAMIYAGVTKPHTFSSGQVISAGQINENFDTIYRAVNTSVIAPPGAVVAFAGNNPPDGWLLCDGGLVSKYDYPELYEAIGTAWGGDGNPNFHLPDMQGRFIRGLDISGFIDPDCKERKDVHGNKVGALVGSLQEDMFKGHNHAAKSSGGTDNIELGNSACTGFAGWKNKTFGYATGSTDEPFIWPSGGSETRPKNAAMHYIIKY
ncbi:MAG TPA: tail fiber protein [Spirochaetota bacterium]|nr:tail fiber protein [Spirochaetota bacterium]HPJ40545.1 tail fiber protein [Spirochaetota bacterium]HPQ52216.1 tail fiber protein [Spirochaetota bacterium]